MRAAPPPNDRSLVEVLSPRSRLGERVEDDDAEAEEPTLQVCEILWWRGYVKSQFYVEADPPLDSLITSRFFRARRSDVPARSNAATAAHAALVAELVSAGWKPDGRGAHWFSDRFRR